MKNTHLSLLTLLLVFVFTFNSNAQVGIGTNDPDPSSILEVNSTDRGILIPRLSTSQRNAISSPAEGLIVYDTNFKSLFTYTGSSWNNLGAGKFYDGATANSAVYGTGNVGIGTNNPEELLDVNGNAKIDGKIILSDFFGDLQYITAETGDIQIHSDAYGVEVTADAGLTVHQGIRSYQRVTIDDNLKVVGKTRLGDGFILPTSEKLEVNGNAKIDGRVIFSNPGDDDQYITSEGGFIQIHCEDSGVEITAIEGLTVHEQLVAENKITARNNLTVEGKVSIGSPNILSTSEKLEVDGNIRLHNGYLIMEDVITGDTYKIEIQEGDLVLTEL